MAEPHPRMAQAFAILRFQNALVGREGPDLEQTYRRVIDVLSRAGAQWSVVGAHAVNVYVEPRATVDVDFVVEARKMKPILRALEEEFGTVETTEIARPARTSTGPPRCATPPRSTRGQKSNSPGSSTASTTART